MRLLYFGLPLGALALARCGFRPRVVSVGHQGASGMRRLHKASACSVSSPLILLKPNLEDRQVVRTIASTEPDAILCWYWPRRIPSSVLQIPRWGTYGVHPSLLPLYPGPDPFFHAIDHGDSHTGVSLHALEAQYDTGRIVRQTKVAMDPSDNAYRLARKLDRPSLELVLFAANELARTQAPLVGVAQPQKKRAWASSPDDEMLELDFSLSAIALERRVRAAAPSPGAWCVLEDHEVYVLRARIHLGHVPSALRPGEAFPSRQGVAVVCGDGALELLEVESTNDATKRKGAAIMQLLQK